MLSVNTTSFVVMLDILLLKQYLFFNKQVVTSKSSHEGPTVLTILFGRAPTQKIGVEHGGGAQAAVSYL